MVRTVHAHSVKVRSQYRILGIACTNQHSQSVRTGKISSVDRSRVKLHHVRWCRKKAWFVSKFRALLARRPFPVGERQCFPFFRSTHTRFFTWWCRVSRVSSVVSRGEGVTVRARDFFSQVPFPHGTHATHTLLEWNGRRRHARGAPRRSPPPHL